MRLRLLLLAATFAPALASAQIQSNVPVPAWSTFTPSPSCGTATFTVNSARSQTVGKITHVEADLTIAAIGTCTTPVTLTLPNTANSAAELVVRETVNRNQLGACDTAAASATATCIQNGATAYAVNDRLKISGIYENQ
jgi:hypothetical protein